MWQSLAHRSIPPLLIVQGNASTARPPPLMEGPDLDRPGFDWAVGDYRDGLIRTLRLDSMPSTIGLESSIAVMSAPPPLPSRQL